MPSKKAIYAWNNSAINRADALIVYITAYDCIGTVYEIAYAQDRGIPTYVIFAPGIDREEFWYPLTRAVRLHRATATVEGLPAVVSVIVENLVRRRMR